MFFSIKVFITFLKNSLNLMHLTLIDIVGIDINTLPNYNFFFKLNFQNKLTEIYNFLLIYNLLDYKNQFRYIINFFYKPKMILYSIEDLFANANWVERELIEFFGLTFERKIDTRNLLLDYNLNINPLLKNFPVEGYQELYFNFENYNLDYINTEFIEL